MRVPTRRTVVVALALLCLAGGVVAAATVPVDRALVVRDADTGERLLTEPVDEGTPVTVEYTHSVEKTPVVDAYEVRGTELDNVRMEFSSYGAGLPANQDIERENGSFVFDPNRSYDELVVNPGSVADHSLVVGDEHYDLVVLSDGSAVVFTVERRTAVGIITEHLNLQ
jgi:hypothetical protein